jgi:hypothetical protein
MRRPLDELSQIHIASGSDLGDYAFHELRNAEDWFVDELPDGRARWDRLPASHPLSLAMQATVPCMAAMPPPIPIFKVPLLSRPSVRAGLLGFCAAAIVGMIVMGVRSPSLGGRIAAAQATAALATEPAATTPAPSVPPAAAPRAATARPASGLAAAMALPAVSNTRTAERTRSRKTAGHHHGKRGKHRKQMAKRSSQRWD